MKHKIKMTMMGSPPPPADEAEPKAVACPKCFGLMLECVTFSRVSTSNFWLFPLDRKGRFDTRGTGSYALVCENCGYTELYAQDLSQLKPKPQ